jgi:hypothetical protein
MGAGEGRYAGETILIFYFPQITQRCVICCMICVIIRKQKVESYLARLLIRIVAFFS